MEGSSKEPVKMSLAPGANANGSNGAANGSSNGKKKAFKTVSGLSKELDEANKRIALLEAKLKENGIDF